MSYEPTVWKDGDLVTSAKLNKMEQGIANGSGGSLIVHGNYQTGELDKTWREIYDAIQEKYVCIVVSHNDENTMHSQIINIGGMESDGQIYTIVTAMGEPSNNQWTYQAQVFITDSEDGYPIIESLYNNPVTPIDQANPGNNNVV